MNTNKFEFNLENPYDYLKDYENQIIDYKDFCELIQEPIKDGSERRNQLKRFKMFFDLSLFYGKVKINKILDISWLNKDISDIENIKYYMKLTSIVGDRRFSNFNINYKYSHKSGIYKIQLNNIIYIGQTNCFIDRFNAHYRGNPLDLKTRELLINGGTFEILELENNKNKRNELEFKYINKYKKDKNYICINTDNFDYDKSNSWKNIKIRKNNYEKVINILKDNNIEVKQNK